MLRQARLDGPGTLHYVMGPGIEGTKIFRNKGDWTDFLQYLAEPCQDGGLILYAWALMPKHVYLLVRTGSQTVLLAIEKGEGITRLRSDSRTRRVSKAYRLFCQLAVGKMGYPGAEVTRFPGVTTLAVVRAAETKGRTKNNLAFLHPVFTTSLIDPQSQNPQHNTAMPVVLLNQID